MLRAAVMTGPRKPIEVRELALLARHRDRLPFASVIGGSYGLLDAARALADVEAMRVTKAVIRP
jgi:hypothetical protein